jgi:imidazoleglycerol-phosphate dehydratase / histidinol-phosphatase
MSTPTLFVDCDGALIEEPPEAQVDELSKIRFMPGVFPALLELTRRGFELVMVTNQDGLGSSAYPEASFRTCHDFVVEAFRSQGVTFDAIFICPHSKEDACSCRKPQTGLVDQYLKDHRIDLERSAVIGDRQTDLELAKHLKVRGFTVSRTGAPGRTWPYVVQALTARHASLVRKTQETHVDVRVNLDREDPGCISTGIGFFDHMLAQLANHGGFALELQTLGDLHIDEHHTVEDSALALGKCLRQALGDCRGLARYGFLLPMDESEARVSVDLSGRSFSTFSGTFGRDQVGQFPTELVPHFFRSFSDGLGAALHIAVSGENTHHMIEACFKSVGRALRQAFRVDGYMLPTTKGLL